MMNDYIFTSESVSDGHPDKVADQISDALVDAGLKNGDETTRVAIETLVTSVHVSANKDACVRPARPWTSANLNPGLTFPRVNLGSSTNTRNVI